MTVKEGSLYYQRYPKVNDIVIIHIKPYKNNFHQGKIQKVLTKKAYHSRGHKVKLYDNTIGRIVRFMD